jgi:hypothetical protein
MADEQDTEELEIVEVDKLPTPEEIAARAADDGAAGDEDDHDDEDEGDTRLGDQDDDEDVDGSKAKAKRKQRRQLQKAARDRTLAEVDYLRGRVAELEPLQERIARLEGATVGMTEREIGNKLENAKSRLTDLNKIIADAVESGNGAAATSAMDLRDATRDELRGYEAAQDHLTKAREEKPAPAAPRADPVVSLFADQWKNANASWYGKPGYEENTRLANAIDNQLTAEKFDPKTPTYWQELTKRVKDSLGSNDDSADRGARNGGQRKGPPIGDGRSAAAPGGKSQVYVTPERKAAMVEAGMWDDPVKRGRMLKRYREQDALSGSR